MSYNESDTRAKLIDPAIHSCGWTEDLIRREETAGSVEIVEGTPRRRAKGRVDYVLRIKVNLEAQPVAVALIEAKSESLPPGHGCVSLGWRKIGDLSALPSEREAFKAAVTKAYPDKTLMAIANNAGMLYRFVHEMKKGDLIVYPSKIDKQIHVGRVESAYRYDAKIAPDSPHLRTVTWLRAIPHTALSQGALHEARNALSFFQIRTYAVEYLAALDSKTAPTLLTGHDPTVTAVADDIEETTRDFVLKRLAQELKGHPLAEFIAHLLGCMGYRTRLAPPGPDGGVDIVAHKDELGFEPPIVKVQVKSSQSSIGRNEVSDLTGTLASAHEFGLFITLGTFSPPAKSFAQGKSNLRLIDGDELVDLVLAHYEQFDSRYKGLLPLKRVYVPEPLEDPED